MGRRPDAKSGRRSCALAVRRRDGPVGGREARVARRALAAAGLDALPAAADFDSVLHLITSFRCP